MSTLDQWLWNFKQLNNQYESLDSFQKVEIWIENVENCLSESIGFRTQLVHEREYIENKIGKTRESNQNKSLFQKAFGSRKEENELVKGLEEQKRNIVFVQK
jgi:hypothetical protein